MREDARVLKNWRKINCWAQIITRRSRYGFWWFVLNNWFFFNFLTPAHPHAQSLFLFPIVFGINTIVNRQSDQHNGPAHQRKHVKSQSWFGRELMWHCMDNRVSLFSECMTCMACTIEWLPNRQADLLRYQRNRRGKIKNCFTPTIISMSGVATSGNARLIIQSFKINS